MVNQILELKRSIRDQMLLEMEELGNDSQQVVISNLPRCEKQPVGTHSQLPSRNSVQGEKGRTILSSGWGKQGSEVHNPEITPSVDTSLELNDTEHQELKVGKQRNGKKYSVRTNRLRFFYPFEWRNFLDCLNTEKQRRAFDILINTGCRINEARHIKKEDIDLERKTLTLKVTKIKAKKGERFPSPRTFKISTHFTERLRVYTKESKDDDCIKLLSTSALNMAMKNALKKAGIKDWYMFSVHNVRKTHGNWLNAHKVTIASICKRLGHDMNTFLKSYASPDIFSDKDNEESKEILGDLIK